jgi:hypothetical protein
MVDKVTYEQLIDLYLRVKELFPRTTIDEFEDIILHEGYWDTYARIGIQEEFSNHLKKRWGGNGKHYIKRKFNEFLNGTLEDPITKNKRLLEMIG